MKDTRIVLAGLVIGFLVLTVLASRCEDERLQEGAAPAPPAIKVVYPRDRPDPIRMRKAARKKGPVQQKRANPKQIRDRLEAVMSAPGGEGSVFVELNAIRHSEVANKILKCRQEEALGVLDDIQERLGIDPRSDIDRVALSGSTLAVSGYFENLTLPEDVGEGEVYGSGRVFEVPGGTNSKGEIDDPVHFALLGSDMVVTGPDPESVRAAIDRADGRAPLDRMPALVGARGEIYGRFGSQFITGLIGDSGDPMVKKIGELLAGGVVRMEIDEHVSMSLDLEATDPETGRDLAQTVGGLFAGLRLKAQQEDRPEVAQLLEQARVQPGEDGHFDVDVAFPGDLILQALGCDADGNQLARTALPPPTP